MDIPAVGSDLPVGHMPLFGFFLVPQPSAACPPFVCAEAADSVEFVEAEELSDDAELVRWAVLRGPDMNILLTSSEEPRALCPPLLVFHPVLEGGWNAMGEATAVIGIPVVRLLPDQSGRRQPSCPGQSLSTT